LAIELVLKFDARFNSPDFQKIRRKAAASLLTLEYEAAEDVFDLFEMIGFLVVRRKVIDEEFAWHTFWEWVHGYWSAGADHIAKKRKAEKDTAYWADFETLHAKLLEIQRKKVNKSEPERLAPEILSKFLDGELE